MKKATKEELRKQLNKIEEQESREFRDKHWPEFEKMIGKVFKERNSYGGNSKPWFRYTAILDIDKRDIYPVADGSPSAVCTAVSFEKTSDGDIIFHTNHKPYVHSVGKKISAKEYAAAKRKIQKEIYHIL